MIIYSGFEPCSVDSWYHLDEGLFAGWDPAPMGHGEGQRGTGGDQRRLPGDDFYAAPKLSPNGQQLAYIAWNHPSMPWDCTELSVATLKDDGAVDTKDCDG